MDGLAGDEDDFAIELVFVKKVTHNRMLEEVILYVRLNSNRNALTTLDTENSLGNDI